MNKEKLIDGSIISVLALSAVGFTSQMDFNKHARLENERRDAEEIVKAEKAKIREAQAIERQFSNATRLSEDGTYSLLIRIPVTSKRRLTGLKDEQHCHDILSKESQFYKRVDRVTNEETFIPRDHNSLGECYSAATKVSEPRYHGGECQKDCDINDVVKNDAAGVLPSYTNHLVRHTVQQAQNLSH